MRRLRRVKILATLGPASNEEAVIEELARTGADVFRINMSHASHELLAQTVTRIRNVEERIGLVREQSLPRHQALELCLRSLIKIAAP